MAIRVLVVDDSSFFRRRVSEILTADADLEVIGTAADGAEAVAQAKALRPDVITMDIEMPVLDGISAVRQIMESCPTPILMFSSLTHAGASATLEALDAGALDFLPKKFEDIARNRNDASHILQQRVKAIGRQRVRRIALASEPKRSPNEPAARPLGQPVARNKPDLLSRRSSMFGRKTETSGLGREPSRAEHIQPASADKPAVSRTQLTVEQRYKILAIGTSTGGPVALQKILTQFPANFPYPIVMVQHMPASFTKAFAQRLNGLCEIEVREAADGDILRPGVAYLAPGGMQMLADGRSAQARLRVLNDENERITYRPSVDLTFASLSKVFAGEVLAVILTGMGADGREGCRMLKEHGATIWAQDRDSCVVYGMPQAVASTGIASESYPLEQMADKILAQVGYAPV